MKGSRWFIIFIVVFLLVMFAVEYHLPKKFVWKPTFGHYDKQPFGCEVFDSLLLSSLPHGYALSKKSFYQLEQEDTVGQCKGILAIADDLILSSVDVKALLRMADRGNKIMLVSTLFGTNLEDTLDFRTYYSYFSPMALKKYAASLLAKDSICWVGDSTVYSRRTFYFYPQFCSSYFWMDSLRSEVLAQRVIDSNEFRYETEADSLVTDSLSCIPVAMSYRHGKGEIILVSTPLLFTNYGMLDGGNGAYLFRLLSHMGDLPVLRTEGYTKETVQVQKSPFRYFLSQPPLRWALYLTMIAILLFMIFTAKRRQRVIPVIREPANRSLEFTELIGTLYFQKKDHDDLVRKKFTYFAEELRREIQVDIEEVADDERSFHRIAQKTGMEVEEIAKFIREVRPVIYGGRRINAEQMKVLIDKMNEIINHI